MSTKHILEKLSIGIAGLALVCPLVLGSAQSVNAKSVNKIRTTRIKKFVIHRPSKREALVQRISADRDILNSKRGRYYLGIKNNLSRSEKLLRKIRKNHKAQYHVKHYRKNHKYYKGFAYNKHEYKLYKEMLPGVNQSISNEKNQLNYNHQPTDTKRGIDDAINHAFTLRLKNNSQYRKGYMKVLNQNAKEAAHLQVMEYVKTPSFSKPISVFNVKQLYKSNTKNLKGWTSAQDLKLAAHQNRL